MTPKAIIDTAQAVGAVVPFTSSRLTFTRIRRGNEGGMEAVLPSLVGGQEVYIVQLGDLPRLYPLPLYDRLLLEEVVATEAVTPADLRRAALMLDQDGARGSERRRSAQEEATAERAHTVAAYFTLLEQLRDLALPSLPAWTLDRYDLTAAETNGRINTVVEAAAKRYGKGKPQIVALVERFADLMAPTLGLESSRGWLVALLYAVRAFIADLSKLRLGGCVETQEALSFIRLAGRETDRLVTPLLHQAQEGVGALDTWLQRPEETEKGLRPLVDAVGWSLDGWSALIAHWAGASDHAQLATATVEQAAPNVPFLPIQAFAAQAGRDKTGALTRGRAALRSMAPGIIAGAVDGATLDLLRLRHPAAA